MSATRNVACAQMRSSDHLIDNLQTTQELIQAAADAGNDLLLLPENFAWIGNKENAFPPDSHQLICEFLTACAKKHAIWVIAGSTLAPSDNDDPRPYNRTLVFDPQGNMVAHYDKIHLFSAQLADEIWQESDHIQAGKAPCSVHLDKQWKLGLSICYDLRFPELYRNYSARGCNLLAIPAAFTVPTGQAHWEVLLRARAIENQCYVLASGQEGRHADGRQTYGHSMIINPWGDILTELPTGEGIIQAEISLQQLHHARHQLPALQHRQEFL